MNSKYIYALFLIIALCSCESSQEENSRNDYSLDSLIKLKTPDTYTAFKNMANTPETEIYVKLTQLLTTQDLENLCASESKILWDYGFTIVQDSLINVKISTFLFDKKNNLKSNQKTFDKFDRAAKKLKKSDFSSLNDEVSGDYHFILTSESLCK